MEKLITINCITYYKNHFCKCGCGGRILYPTNINTLKKHKCHGIPEYIVGHSNQFKKGELNPNYGKFGKLNPNYIDGFGQIRSMNIINSKRRNLNFIELNEPTEESTSPHHIDEEKVIWIPLKLHKSIPHRLDGYNLELMNDLAFNWMFEQIDKEFGL